MGLLDTFFGNADQTQAMGLLGAAMASGKGFGPGAGFAMQHLAEAPQRRRQGLLEELKLQEAQSRMEDARRKRDFLANLPDPTFVAGQQALSGGGGPTVANAGRIAPVNPMQHLMLQGVKAGEVSLPDYLKTFAPKQLEFSKVDPKDYTQESLIEAARTGDYTKLVPVRKMDVVNNQAVNLFETKPGTVFDTFDPNKPFNLRGGQAVPNTPFQQFEIGKARAGKTDVHVNTERSFLGEIAGGFGKSISGARDGAQAALGTISTVGRLFDALDSGKVMAGPGTTFRQYGLQVGELLGVAGKDAQEKLLNTRQAIQSLAQLELDAAQQMKGQGQITEAERAIIRRAASGDIDGMTAQELRLLGGVLDRAARWKIRNYNSQVSPLASNPNAAPIAPFLNVEEPPERPGASGVRRYNPATRRIE